MTLAEKLKQLPTSPGIYLHKNAAGKIIYVGKAKNLRNRVRSYFQSSRNMDPKTRRMVKLIADFEFIVVDNEVEALVLESNLIKKHKPRFNVFLKDDKQYPHLKVTNEPFPKVVITRKIVRGRLELLRPISAGSVCTKNTEPDKSCISTTHMRDRDRRQTAAAMPRISSETLSRSLRQRPMHAGGISGSGHGR